MTKQKRRIKKPRPTPPTLTMRVAKLEAGLAAAQAEIKRLKAKDPSTREFLDSGGIRLAGGFDYRRIPGT